MNLVDATVTKVLGPPVEQKYPDVLFWSVPVEYTSWGRIGTSNLTFTTKELAEKCKKGYSFLV